MAEKTFGRLVRPAVARYCSDSHFFNTNATDIAGHQRE
jgi:hypothetical protein